MNPLPVYQVLDKDTIKEEILPYLPTAKRGYKTKSCLEEIIQGILYKLKTGCQWHMLPVERLFSGVVLSYKSVYWHFRKWSAGGYWKQAWCQLVHKHKNKLDLSCIQLDGSHTTSFRGGQKVAYQGRKKRKTTNNLFITDNQGIPLAVSQAECGNFNDVYRIEQTTSQLFETMQDSGLSTDGLFLNADAGFDTKLVRSICDKNDIIANIAINKRNGIDSDSILLL